MMKGLYDFWELLKSTNSTDLEWEEWKKIYFKNIDDKIEHRKNPPVKKQKTLDLY